jgi:polysaccharide pyruvyl transferase WcaK-like protein
MKIVVTHGYSDSNKGDLAITSATIQAIKRIRPDAEITMLSTFKKNSKDFWYHNRMMKDEGIAIEEGILPSPYVDGEKSLKNNLMAVMRLVVNVIQLKVSMYVPFLGKLFGGTQYKALKIMKQADLIVVKGGQFIYNDKEDLRGNLFLWRTLQPLEVGIKLNKPIYIMGQSIGPFATDKSKAVAFNTLKNCSKLILREQLSYDLMKEQIPEEKLELAPDMAFLIKEKETRIKELKELEGKDILGITVVNWTFPEQQDVQLAKENYINNLVSAVKEASEKHSLTPVFIPQVTVRHHGKSDNDLIKIAQAKLKEENITSYFIDEDLTANEMSNVYKSCKILIGTRLHSCILALTAGTPVVAIRYQGYKTQGVMKMAGLGQYVHDINDVKKDELLLSIDDVLANYKSVKNQIQHNIEQMQIELEDKIREILWSDQKKEAHTEVLV